MGGGILNFVYPTELFPTSIRASAAGFATSVSRIGSILGTLVFPNFVAWWGEQFSTLVLYRHRILRTGDFSCAGPGNERKKIGRHQLLCERIVIIWKNG
ncbi:hypothetical protein RWE15_05565 [Virgibacillus halophilus]|uniref:Sugar transporter n=1 Tax=Tigheibacillus halophilus TaxID=361280 RepID=A0ABU5C3Z3_9BACI|nr:hypothetical protein [Virgibacillus halophilus]